MPLNKPTICILGCGTMGVAIIRGTLDSISGAGALISSTATIIHTTGLITPNDQDDLLRPAGFIACVGHENSVEKLRTKLGNQVKVLHGADGNVQGVTEADVILLCTKPQVAKAVLSAPGVKEALTDKLLISICAGVTIDQLQSWTNPTTTVIRAMPNTPCKIREGMTVLSCKPGTDLDSMTFTTKIFATLGRCRVLDEKHLDAVTALAGSGPAFACVMLEALADGGVMMGLPRDVATELAAQGNAVGDAYGLATEFMSKSTARERYGNGPIAFGKDKGYPVWVDSHRSKWERNDFTDDTDQMLLLLQSLQQTRDGRLHAANFAKRLKEWSVIGFPELDTPPRGIGFTVGSTLSHPEFRFNPHKAAFDIWNAKGRTLAANGAIMRTSVLGIESFWDEARVVENALAAAKVTHADPRSIISALIASVLISRLLRGGGQNVEEDTARTWNPRLGQEEYKHELLDYLRRGTDIEGEQSSDPIYEPAQSTYSNKDAKEIRQKRLTATAAAAGESSLSSTFRSAVVNRVVNFILGDSTVSRASPDAWNQGRPKATLRDDIGWAGLDKVGEDQPMGSLARSVVHDYGFLLQETDVLPTIAMDNVSSESLDGLELGDAISMGYTFKCLGIGIYAATRNEDHAPSEATYRGPSGLFRGIAEQVTLEAGDADTNGAVVGSLLGARFGLVNGIPHAWWSELRHYQWLRETVDEFADRVIAMYEEQQRV
ncbi:delta 1-pyrroline-5-carboxylate reductase, partial [Modicella reniformis]